MEFIDFVNYLKAFNLFNISSYIYWDSFILWSIHWLLIIVYFYRGMKYIIRDFYMLVFVQLQRRNKKYYKIFYSFFKVYFFITRILKKFFLFKFLKKIYLKYKIKQISNRIKKKKKIIRRWGKWNHSGKKTIIFIKKKINLFFFFLINNFLINFFFKFFKLSFNFIYYFFKFFYFNLFLIFKYVLKLFYWRRVFWTFLVSNWIRLKFYFIFKIFSIFNFKLNGLRQISNFFKVFFLINYLWFWRLVFRLIYTFYTLVFFIFFLRWVYQFMDFLWLFLDVTQATALLPFFIYLVIVFYALYPRFRKWWKQDWKDFLVYFFCIWLIVYWNARGFTISWTSWIFQNILTYEEDYGYYVRKFFKGLHYRYKSGYYLYQWDQNFYLKYELWNYFIIRILMLWGFRLWWWGLMFELNEYRVFLSIFSDPNHSWMVNKKVFPFFGPNGMVKESIWVRDPGRTFEYLWFINTDRRSIVMTFDYLDYMWAKFEKPLNFTHYHTKNGVEMKPYRKSNYWIRYRDIFEIQFPGHSWDDVERALLWDISERGWKSLLWNPNLTWDYKIKQ